MEKYIVSLLICVMSLFSSCAEDSEMDPNVPLSDYEVVIGSSRAQPGLGDNDGAPLGSVLNLPEGIRIVERSHKAFDPTISKLYAHANFFYTDVNLVNDRMPGTPPVYVEFPPGLIVVSMDHDKQNGISFERFLVPVPPTEKIGGGRDTTTVYLGMACLNEKRSMPWYDNQGDEQRYPISRNNFNTFLVTSDANLLKFIDLVKGHPGLKVTQHWDPVAAHEEDYVVPEWMKIHGYIQDLIWKITDGHGILKKDTNELQQRLGTYK
jgi:hypothetical protein